jgi:hypothetical protein
LSDLVTGIYPNQRPEQPTETDFPFIIVLAMKPPEPERSFKGGGTIASTIAFERASYQVKVCDQATAPDRADDIATAILTALDGATVTIDGYTSLNVEWMRDIDMSEVYDGQIYQYRGGFYEVWASAN